MPSLTEQYSRELRDVRDLSQNTVKAYTQAVTSLEDWLKKRNTQLRGATRDDIVTYKAHLIEEKSSAATVRLFIAGIRTFYNWLVSIEKIKVNPVPAEMTVRHKEQEPTDVPTVQQFLEMRARLAAYVPDRANALDAQTRTAIVEVLAGSGLRLDALLTLRPSHLRLGDRPHIMVDAGTMSCKGKSAGEIPISPYAASILSSYVAARGIAEDRPLFDVSASMIHKILNQIEPAGLNCKPHSLRHFYGSMMYFRNFDGKEHDVVWVRDAMGHASISTTDKYLKMARRVCQTAPEWEAWATGKAIEKQEVKTA